MHWIALQWPPEAAVPAAQPLPPPEALGWWALRFTPHVARLDEALLLEVSACERLWGGRRGLLRALHASNPAPAPMWRAQGATSLIALARLRQVAAGRRPPAGAAALPLHTLTAARAHLDLLARMGCHRWGDVMALPRGGLARRFGAALREALDIAWGERPERHAWLQLPEVFDQRLDLPALAEDAPALMWTAQRLLAALRLWLVARQRGVLALEFEWALDLRRVDGVELPPRQQLLLRTAEPTQDLAHLRRLLAERLARRTLAAPANALRLRSLETAPWAAATRSFLPEDDRPGDRLHQLVERLSARLGPQQVRVPQLQADHRPERMQVWQPAQQAPRSPTPAAVRLGEVLAPQGALAPAWLLREPLRLAMEGEHPCYQGRLRRLIGPQRVEAGWWGDEGGEGDAGDEGREGGHPAVRDYYIAESPQAGLVWIYRERPTGWLGPERRVRWYLQGLYA